MTLCSILAAAKAQLPSFWQNIMGCMSSLSIYGRPAEFLDEKFKVRVMLDRISAIQMDATQPLPFPEDYFDAIFCMNSFNFYGGNLGFLQHLLKHLKPGGQLCIGSEVLSAEFTKEQIATPPHLFMRSGCRLPMNT